MSDVAAAMKRIRQRHKKTLTAFAADLGVTQGAVSQYESGKIKPGFPALIKLFQLTQDMPEERVVILGLWQNSLNLPVPPEAEQLSESVKFVEAAMERVRRGDTATRAIQKEQLLNSVRKIIERDRDPGRALVVIVDFWEQFGEEPVVQKAFGHAAAFLLDFNELTERKPDHKFENLSEKEAQRIENLIYFMRHAEADEVEEMVRRAAIFRKHSEKERKTSEVKQSGRSRR